MRFLLRFADKTTNPPPIPEGYASSGASQVFSVNVFSSYAHANPNRECPSRSDFAEPEISVDARAVGLAILGTYRA